MPQRVTTENIEIVKECLGFDFLPTEFRLGPWGIVDLSIRLEDVLLLVEVEKGQKHPNTNVLKVWPFLEENKDEKVVLLQIIREENRASSNRIALCKFTGLKLERLFPDRFRYLHYNRKNGLVSDIESKVEQLINELK